MKNNVKVILFYVLLIATIFVAVFAIMGNPSSNQEPIFSDIMELFAEDRVKEFEVSSENVLTLIVYKTDKEGVLTDVTGLKTERSAISFVTWSFSVRNLKSTRAIKTLKNTTISPSLRILGGSH